MAIEKRKEDLRKEEVKGKSLENVKGNDKALSDDDLDNVAGGRSFYGKRANESIARAATEDN